MLTFSRTAGNATGNRAGGTTEDPAAGLTQQKAIPVVPVKKKDGDIAEGFGLDHFQDDVKGSLKIHIKLDLDVDIHITARIKGDIAIGLL